MSISFTVKGVVTFPGVESRFGRLHALVKRSPFIVKKLPLPHTIPRQGAGLMIIFRAGPGYMAIAPLAASESRVAAVWR